MTNPADIIRRYFAALDLEPEVADLYVVLHKQGRQTISELARNSGVERTRIYRLLEQLQASNLVEIETEYKRSLLRAAPITNVRVLMSRREQELRGLEAELSALEQAFANTSLASPAARVQFYRGPEGVKQMFWNQTRAHTEMRSILHKNMQIKTQSAFFERWVERCNERGLRSRGIIGDAFVASQQQWYARRQNQRLNHWQARRIDPAIFSITHGMTLYDDVVSYFTWKDNEVFGVEIYNADIAASQSQFWDLLWTRATPVDDLTGQPPRH